jgi:hypothetical protein
MESGGNPHVWLEFANGPVLARFSAFWPPNSFIINRRILPSGPSLARSLPLETHERTRNPHRPRAVLDLGRLPGQRRAFGAIAGRCSAAHAQLLRTARMPVR